MQARYIGSDKLSQVQLEAQLSAAKANELAIQRTAAAADSTVQGIVEGQRQLGALATANATAKAQASASGGGGGGGFVGLAKVAVEGLEAYSRYEQGQAKAKLAAEQQEAAEAQAAAKAAAEAEQTAYERNKDERTYQLQLGDKLFEREKYERDTALKASDRERALLADNEYAQALNEVGQLTATYVRDRWQQGTLNYRNQAAQVLAKYRNLTPDKAAALVEKINNAGLGRDEETRKWVDGEVDKLQNAVAERETLALSLSFKTDLQTLKRLPPTEQAKPWLESFNSRLDAFLQQNNGLSFPQKLEAVNKVSAEILSAFEGKAEGYAEFVSGMKGRAEWNTGYQALYAQYQKDNNLSAFKDGLNLLTIRTGKDYSKYMVAPGEAEKNALEIGQTLSSMQKLRDDQAERAGLSFNFSEGESRLISAGILLMPGFQQQLETNPVLFKNPGVKAGVALAKRLQEARVAFAGLGVENAQAQRQIADLDLTNVNNFSSVTRQIINKESSGQQLTPQQAYFKAVLEQAVQANPAIGEAIATINSAGGSSLSREQAAQIQQTLQNQSAAINNAKKAQAEVYNQKVQATYAQFDDVIKAFGGIPTDEQLKKFFQGGKQQLDATFQRWKAESEAAAQQAVPTPGYGAQGSFSQVGQGLAASDSPSGGYTVAPRTAAMVQTKNADGGAPWITPVAAGLGIRHSFNRGMMGGGYRAGRSGGRKHAGIDFPLSGGQNAVAVVSGTVVKVGSNPGGYGNYIDIRGDNGFVYRYAHQRPFVRQGQRVKAGQAVSTSDGSGAGAHHLHFEVLPGAGYAAGRQYGIGATVDPVAHLRSLTAKMGQSVGGAPQQMRGQQVQAVRQQLPWAKTTSQSIFTNGGGAINAGFFQQVGRPVQQASATFGNQRPLTKGFQPAKVAGAVNNAIDDYGYAWIRQRPDFARKLQQVANRLGVPGQWIADIMRQESGDNFKLHNRVHPGSSMTNYGLFGFGRDSGVRNHTSLSVLQQLEAYQNYMLTNGWDNHRKRTGGQVTLGQLWAVTRMGVNWRKQILNGREPSTLRLNDTGLTYADELKLLGKWAGREYDVGGGRRSGRANRNRASGRRASNVVDQALVANNTEDVIYRPAA